MLVPSYTILITFGLLTLHKLLKYRWKRAIMTLVVLLLIGNFYDFIRDYWYDYPSRARISFPSAAHLGYKALYEQSRDLGLPPIIQVDVRGKELAAVGFFEKIYFSDSRLGTWQTNQPLPDKGVVLHHGSDSAIFSSSGYQTLPIEMPYYKISYKK